MNASLKKAAWWFFRLLNFAIWLVGLSTIALGVLIDSVHAAERGGRFSLVFDRVPLQQLVMLHYDNCEKRGIVFGPGIQQQLEEPLTLKAGDLTCAESKGLVSEILSRVKLSVVQSGVLDMVISVQDKDERDGWRELIYRPLWRDPLELAELSSFAVRKGSWAHARKVSVPAATDHQVVPENGSNGSSLMSKQLDSLVFFGPSVEVESLRGVLSRIDVPVGQVELRAAVFEFQRTKTEASAINAVAKLLDKKLSIRLVGGSSAALGNGVKIEAGTFEGALELLDADSRFHYIARPKVLVRDGEEVKFFAGEDLRVVGNVLMDGNGNPVQSRETLSAGVTLAVTPRVRGSVVDVSLLQSVSNFTAANDQAEPSILKREIRSRLMMQPGAVYLVGGLQSVRKTTGENRLFGWRLGGGQQDSESEIVLLLVVGLDETSI